MIELFKEIKTVTLCAFAFLLVLLCFILFPLPFIVKEIIYETDN